MILRTSLVALALVCGALSTGAQANPLVEQIKAFTTAYNAKDATAVAGFYLEKGALLPPRSAALVGQQAIARHYAHAFSNGVSNLRYKILEIEQVGPTSAIEIGETRVSLANQEVHGRSLHVWKKSGEKWLLARDMYHVISVSK